MAPNAMVHSLAAARLWAGSRRFPGIALVYIGEGAAFQAWIRRYDEYI
jgi:hypothetical protein